MMHALNDDKSAFLLKKMLILQYLRIIMHFSIES